MYCLGNISRQVNALRNWSEECGKDQIWTLPSLAGFGSLRMPCGFPNCIFHFRRPRSVFPNVNFAYVNVRAAVPSSIRAASMLSARPWASRRSQRHNRKLHGAAPSQEFCKSRLPSFPKYAANMHARHNLRTIDQQSDNSGVYRAFALSPSCDTLDGSIFRHVPVPIVVRCSSCLHSRRR